MAHPKWVVVMEQAPWEEEGFESPLEMERGEGNHGALYPQPLIRLVALPVIPIPSLPCAKKGVGQERIILESSTLYLIYDPAPV